MTGRDGTFGLQLLYRCQQVCPRVRRALSRDVREPRHAQIHPRCLSLSWSGCAIVVHHVFITCRGYVLFSSITPLSGKTCLTDQGGHDYGDLLTPKKKKKSTPPPPSPPPQKKTPNNKQKQGDKLLSVLWLFGYCLRYGFLTVGFLYSVFLRSPLHERRDPRNGVCSFLGYVMSQ